MKKQLIISTLIFCTLILKAQEPGHSFFINAGGGFHAIQYDLTNGNTKGGAGFTFNAGYSYYFSKHWGIITGLGMQTLKSKATLNYMNALQDVDTDGDTYEYRTYFKDWTETQSAYLLDVPIGIAIRGNMSTKIGWELSMGGKVSIPVNATYKGNSGEISTTGYYSQWNAELSNMPQHGFLTYSDRPKGDLSLNTAYLMFTDLGLTFKLSEKLNLYTGAYVNYGLNKLMKEGNSVVYQKDGTYNSVMTSGMVSNVRMITTGIKIGLVWNFGKKKKVEAASAPEVHVVPIAEKKGATQKNDQQAQTLIANERTDSTLIDPFDEANAIAKSTIIRFALKSDLPSTLDDTKIKRLAVILKSHPDMLVVVTGHTCDIATRQVNMRISADRAQTIKNFFLQQGIPDRQIRCEAKASDEPLVPNNSEENRVKNRRVELKIERIK